MKTVNIEPNWENLQAEYNNGELLEINSATNTYNRIIKDLWELMPKVASGTTMTHIEFRECVQELQDLAESAITARVKSFHAPDYRQVNHGLKKWDVDFQMEPSPIQLISMLSGREL